MNWKKLLLISSIIAFATILLTTQAESIYWNAAAMGGLMIVLWISEAIPIYLTALIPLVAAVPLGLLSSEELAKSYGDRMVYLFFGGFVLAMALEKWKIHLVIANLIINAVGHSKPRILFGFLMATGFLSMWVSNTATALMMLPMAIAIIQLLPEEERKGKFAIYILLSVAYGANIGGMGTLVGSPPNLQMASLLAKEYHTTVDFFDWMVIGIPVAIVMLLGAYAYFYFTMGKERNESVQGFEVEKKGLDRNQWKVVTVFLSVVFLWIFKDIISGETGLLPQFKLTDEAAAILGAVILFLLPVSGGKKGETIISWEETKQLPWGILIMFGGGLALAAALNSGGVIDSLALLIGGLGSASATTLLIVIVVIAVLGTEILSNLALVTLFVPIIATFAEVQGISLVQLCLPLTLAASCGFMMPVGTPPNAIVYASGQVTIQQMIRTGFVVNVIGMIVIVLLSMILL